MWELRRRPDSNCQLSTSWRQRRQPHSGNHLDRVSVPPHRLGSNMKRGRAWLLQRLWGSSYLPCRLSVMTRRLRNSTLRCRQWAPLHRRNSNIQLGRWWLLRHRPGRSCLPCKLLAMTRQLRSRTLRCR